jgi:hypothetical protein
MSLRGSVCTAVLAVSLVLHGGTSAFAAPYRDAARHYTLELPQGWEAMSAQELNQINELLRQRVPGSAIHYHAGLRQTGTLPGTYPYILVQFTPFTSPNASYEDIEQTLKREFPGEVKQAEGVLGDLARNLTVGTPVLDRSRNRILTRVQLGVPFIGTIQGFSVGHIGKEGIVYVHCYAPENDFATLSPAFNRLQESFQYDAGYTFTPAKGNTFMRNIGKHAAVGALIGGVVGALVGGAVGLVKLLGGKKKSKPRRRKARPRREEEEEETL